MTVAAVQRLAVPLAGLGLGAQTDTVAWAPDGAAVTVLPSITLRPVRVHGTHPLEPPGPARAQLSTDRLQVAVTRNLPVKAPTRNDYTSSFQA